MWPGGRRSFGGLAVAGEWATSLRCSLTYASSSWGAAQATTCALAWWEGPGVLLAAQSLSGCIAVSTSVPAPAAELARGARRLSGMLAPVIVLAGGRVTSFW